MPTARTSRRTEAGFTLIEIVFTTLMVSVLATYAAMKVVAPATMTLHAQAQSLADLIRRGQSLAVVRGERTHVAVTTAGANGRVAVACPAIAPCPTDTSLTVSQGAVVGGAGVYFNSLGQPVNSAGTALTTDTTFTLRYATATYTVTVAALTGRVSVSP